ncbi:ChbG/HpnK family deacetylase [Simplicispira hankyongi]|uniref:ChbG/HpnK family deacetylase n=1 Tax=Simplicispira hankyongi TaxID=2315688 RepID=A0A398C8W1_9BURK|nr:ChbG/HpnK family deacetylase [Simplicispira hankyongi]
MDSSSSGAYQHEPGNAPPQSGGGTGVNKGTRAHEAVEHSRSLCIAVDDFGLHAGVCEAALLLAWQGRTQAIGCMVGAPAWGQWAPELEEIDPRQTEIGLHLDLTQHPLLLQPQQLGPLILRSWLRTLDRTSIRSEIRAQLDAFEQQTGRPPAYVDGHQHVHQFPVVRGELLTELQRRYAGNLPWLRNTARAHINTPMPWRQAFKPWTIEALGSAALTRQAQAQGFRQNAHLLGVHDFRGNEDSYLNWTRRWLGACHSGDLLMCHPSLGIHPHDPLAPARLHEYQVLSGSAFGELVQEEAIRLEPLGQTLAQRFSI